jgi:hypothetical protein
MKNILTRIFALVAGTALFVGAFALSIVFFAAVVVLGAAVAAYFLWKTRHVRRQMRQQYHAGDVIEGTVISSRDIDTSEIIERRSAGK